MANVVSNVALDYDQLVIIYNEFVNSMSQKMKKLTLDSKPQFLKKFELLTKYDLSEPDAEFAKQYFYDFYLASNLYYALLHSLASEQASRMNAMENATKNAGEILQRLTMKYNKARQARITMELIEIISGANAL